MLICGSPMGSLMPLRMPKSAGLSCAFGVCVGVKAIEAEARLVDQGGAEGVCLVQRKELPQRMVGVAETGDGVAEPAGLDEVPALDGVVAVQPVFLGSGCG